MVIKRKLFNKLKDHLKQKEISLIVGPRQAGKTTLMFLLKDYLEREGERTVFLNLDIEADKQFFTTQENLLRKIKLEIGENKGVVFIDEIQRKENAGLFLKGIYDMNLPYKFIVSGSGSVELKEKIHESLVGRKRVFELSTLSFEEFVNFKTGYKYEDKLLDFFEVEKGRMRQLLEEYLNFGGYPRVVLEERLEEKKMVIDEIYQSYLEKDISYLLNIRKTEAFGNLVRVLAAQAGNLVNFSELSATLGISQKTTKDYVWCLEKTFILTRVTPYFKNIRKEITKAPIVYFYDLGLRNYALGVFGNISLSGENGFLFQNLVFNLLQEETRSTSAKICFWRTKDGGEVDFIVDFGMRQVPVEVKCRQLRVPEVPRGLKSFIKKYAPPKALIANLDYGKSVIVDKTTISFIPFYKITKALKS